MIFFLTAISTKVTVNFMETNSNNSMQIANTIAKQIGHRALFMLGASRLTAGRGKLGFRIGRNAHGVNYVQVTLTPADLYDVEFMRTRKCDVKTLSKVEGVYADGLTETLAAGTGMAVRL